MKTSTKSRYQLLFIVSIVSMIFMAIYFAFCTATEAYAETSGSTETSEYEIKILTDSGFLWIAKDTCSLGSECTAKANCGIVTTHSVKLQKGATFDFEKFKEHYGKSVGYRDGRKFEYFSYQDEIFGWHTKTVPTLSQSVIVIVPEYSMENYEFIFQAQGINVAPAPQLYTNEDYLSLPTPATREGYVFEGWQVSAINGNTVTNGKFYSISELQSTDPFGDFTPNEQADALCQLTAKFRPLKTVITLHWKNTSPKTIEIEYNQKLSALPNYGTGNYLLQGWYDNEDFLGVLYTKDTVWKNYDLNGGDLHVDLYAKYLGVPASVTYDLDGGTTNNPQTYIDSFTLEPAVKNGYRFDGWIDLETGYSITTISSGSYRLKAVWTKYIPKPAISGGEFVIRDERAIFDFDQTVGKMPETIKIADTVKYIEILGGWDRKFTLMVSIAVESRATELQLKIDAKFQGNINRTALFIAGGEGQVRFVRCSAEIYGGIRGEVGNLLDGTTYCSAIYSVSEILVDSYSNLKLYGGAGFITGAGESTHDAFDGGTALYALGMTVYSGSSVYAYGGAGGDAIDANGNAGSGRYGIRLSPAIGLKNYGYVYCKGGKGGAGKGTGSNGSDYAPINSCTVKGNGTLVKENA